MQVIASLTTIPKRISNLHITLTSILNQSHPLSEIHLNVPYTCLRTGERYEIPNEIRNFPKVKIFRTEDFGAITKIAPTFKRMLDDDETYIWQIDDDKYYPDHALQLLTEGISLDDKNIVCRHGGALNEGFNFEPWYGIGPVNFMEGFGGILYPPTCTPSHFFDLLDRVKELEFIRNSDDILLSMFFNFIGVPLQLHNPISDQNPYQLVATDSGEIDPISKFVQADNYRKSFNTLTRILESERFKSQT